MSKFKLEFTLKQHTPLIHFQADQSGATLRATELKPKLDRFLIEYVFDNDFGKYKEYLIGYKKPKKATDKEMSEKEFEGKKAFNYKVFIEPNYAKPIEIDQKNVLYFAARKPREMSQEEYDRTKKWFKMYDEDFKIYFKTLNPKILTAIKNNFASFLAKTNFGTRQNKGFGSFYLSPDDKHYITPESALNNIHLSYIHAKYYKEKPEQILEHIEVIYPLIKTGINFPDHPKIDDPQGRKDKDGKIKKVLDLTVRGKKASYYKSYLFDYMLNQKPPTGNEKRFIKENFFRPDLRIENDGLQKKYIRALLGICDFVEFKDQRRGTINYHSDLAARFKSPLTFKIVDSHLFIIPETINENIFNCRFEFSHTFRQGNRESTNTETIYTPTKDEFDLIEFLFSFADYFNSLKPQNKNFFDEKIRKAKTATFSKVSP